MGKRLRVTIHMQKEMLGSASQDTVNRMRQAFESSGTVEQINLFFHPSHELVSSEQVGSRMTVNPISSFLTLDWMANIVRGVIPKKNVEDTLPDNFKQTRLIEWFDPHGQILFDPRHDILPQDSVAEIMQKVVEHIRSNKAIDEVEVAGLRFADKGDKNCVDSAASELVKLLKEIGLEHVKVYVNADMTNSKTRTGKIEYS